MNRNQKILQGILGTAFLLVCAAAIFSQQPTRELILQREPWIQEPGSARRIPQPGEDTFYFISSEMSFDGKVVKGAPYSAQAITEMIQTLSDGNRIVNKSSASIYRDSEGRTRREQTIRAIGPFGTAGEPPQTIFISDPVTQMSYVLDARTHVARKMPSFRFEVKVPAPAEGIRTAAPDGPPPPGPPDRENSGNVYVMTSPPAPGGEGYRVEFHGGGERAKAEPLGKQTIEGVEAEGTRTTVTIPAGEIGNERAIEILNERWYSSELQTVVMSRHSDPRFGETVYRLTNIDRSEPDKSLFEIPADYAVKAGPGFFRDSSGGTKNALVSRTGNLASKAISGDVLNGKAISLPNPDYPLIAREAHATGTVTVQITIDEDGNVIAAKAVAGHPLLQAAAVSAARQAKFSPTRLAGQPVKVQGVLIYDFQ